MDEYVDFDAKMTEREMMDALIQELRCLAFTDIAGLYDSNGALKNVHEIDPAIRRAVASIEVDEIWSGTGPAREVIGYTKKVKLWDKKGAIDSFMKHLGMFIEKLEVKKEIVYRVEKVDLEERRLDIKNRLQGVN